MELLTADQMRAIEAAGIASGAVTGLELMERAGQGVVRAILEEWPDLEGRRRGALPPGAADAALPPEYFGKDEGAGAAARAVVLCGPGNNGGDGFVVARLLRERGWEVEVFLYGDPERLPPDARVNHDLWAAGGGRLLDPAGRDRLRLLNEVSVTGPASLVVDAVFGTGLTRPTEVLRDAVEVRDSPPREGPLFVAVDVPSGLCADSGRVLGDSSSQWDPVLPSDLTVTFHRPKVGHRLADGPALCGKVVVVDIGLGSGSPDGAVRLVSAQDTDADPWQVPTGVDAADLRKPVADHKYTHGHALILSGPPGRGGAARLAARGALRIGAGVVTVGCPPEAIPEHAARLDAIMLRPLADAAALAAMLGDPRINALCLGPGMGTDAHAADLLAAALGVPLPGVPGLTRDPDPSSRPASPPIPSLPHKGGGSRPEPLTVPDASSGALPLPLVGRGEGRGASARRALVLDADALTILARRPDLFAALHAGCILTPHAGEFARLFPDIAAKLAEPATRGPAFSRVDATRDAAARAGCVVLFKGPDTVIAHPDGRCAVNSAHHDRAAPWLATAGSGDVLAGFITGLLARGFDPMRAAETAAWLHVEAARSFGPGLIAEDLPEELPKVFRALGL